MKNYILIFCFLFSSILSAQLVVTDPGQTVTSKANLIKNGQILVQAGKTVQEARKTVKLLNDAKEAIEKVSGVIRDLDLVYNLIDMQVSIVNTTEKNISNLKNANVFSGREITNISRSLITFVSNSTKIVKSSDKILSDNLFKMSDGERYQLLKDMEDEMKLVYVEMYEVNRHYTRIMYSRSIKKLTKR